MSRHWHTQVLPPLVTLAARGIALTRCPRMYPLQTGSHSASLSAEQGSGVPGGLLYTSLRHSQPTSFTVSHSTGITYGATQSQEFHARNDDDNSTSPDRTTLPAQHFRLSGLLCRWSNSLKLATGQSPRPSAHQQQFQTIAENEPISSLPAHTAQ